MTRITQPRHVCVNGVLDRSKSESNEKKKKIDLVVCSPVLILSNTNDNKVSFRHCVMYRVFKYFILFCFAFLLLTKCKIIIDIVLDN